MANRYWISEGDCDLGVGEVGYLIEICPQQGVDRFVATREPGRTNMSREPRVRGWLGETDNVQRVARGKCRAIRVDKSRRTLVETVDDTVEATADVLE
jgi:hypothetical protein